MVGLKRSLAIDSSTRSEASLVCPYSEIGLTMLRSSSISSVAP